MLEVLRRMNVRVYTEIAVVKRHCRRLVLQARLILGCSPKQGEEEEEEDWLCVLIKLILLIL